MAGLYGYWLSKDFDFKPTLEKIKLEHPKYAIKFNRRVEAIHALAKIFVADGYSRYPSLKLNNYLHINYPAILIAVGRYINDIMHYKIWHDISVTNRAKMIAHTVKWLSLYNVISIDINREKYESLKKNERQYLLEINTLFIAVVVRYFLSFFCNGDIPSIRSYKKIFYLVETGQYDVKTAAVAFDGMIL